MSTREVSTAVFSQLIAFQYVAIFGFHLLAAMYTSRMHACVPLLRLSAARAVDKSKYAPSTRYVVSLDAYIHKFHVSERYGITYGSFGLMSVKSFLEVSH